MVYITVIKKMAHAQAICQKLLKECNMIAIDIEGVDLGRNDGSISLIQIAASEDEVYCFDILALGEAVFSKKEYLGEIMESDKILKLCYDCRIDGDVLRAKHKVEIHYAYDLQVLYTFVFQPDTDPFLKGLQHALQKPGVMLCQNKFSEKVIQIKKEMKTAFLNERGSHIFMQRPLTDKVLLYCASDVVYLFRMFYLWGGWVPLCVVVQASMYRMHKFGHREKNIPTRHMALVDFKQMPKSRCAFKVAT
jgi:DNA polymerase I-like protein with 3'-5' exonuclease and polymerase domains